MEQNYNENYLCIISLDHEITPAALARNLAGVFDTVSISENVFHVYYRFVVLPLLNEGLKSPPVDVRHLKYLKSLQQHRFQVIFSRTIYTTCSNFLYKQI